ncbi:septation protein A [Marinomonas agarivorans]|nr:septation protein A [Marinomonas agarivorans]
MKILFDFFPILLFFSVYKFTNSLMIATAVLIPASILQVVYSWLRHKTVEKMHLVSTVLVVIFGGATLWLNDGSFIKWKPTILNWLFATVFLGSQFIGSKNIIQRLMGSQLELPFKVWRTLNLAWVGFFILSGIANLYVYYNFSEATWFNFKLFGLLGMTIVFIIAQGIYLSGYLKNESAD